MKNAPLFPPQCLRELPIQKQRWRVVTDQRPGLYSPVPHAPREGFAVKRLEIHGRESAPREAKGPSCTTATESQTTLKALAPAAPVNYSHRMQKRASSALPDERAEAKSKRRHPPLTWKMRINGEERRRARKRQSGLAVACAHQKKLKARKNKGGPFIINFSPPRKHRDGANYCQNVTPSPAASLSTELYPLGIRMMLNTVRWAHTYLYSVNHTGWCWILY